MDGEQINTPEIIERDDTALLRMAANARRLRAKRDALLAAQASVIKTDAATAKQTSAAIGAFWDCMTAISTTPPATLAGLAAKAALAEAALVEMGEADPEVMDVHQIIVWRLIHDVIALGAAAQA